MYIILEALKSYNDHELVIGVANNGSTQETLENFRKNFIKDFYKLHLPQSEVTLKKYNPSESGWLWIPEKLELVMKLERKRN